jgi:CubicO group peptidase (beta-lactamase class C family)
MNIASISKTIVGASIMRAVEQGRLSLDADINQYLPFKVVNPHCPREIITLRNLATHTSGITDRDPIYGQSYHYGGDAPEALGAFLENYFSPNGKYYAADNFTTFKPGQRTHYSNIGAGLAGYIVETVTGEPLNVYSKSEIFQPLGMNSTGWFLREVEIENHSTLYDQVEDSIRSIELYGLTTYPDGGVRTSVRDLSKFLICLTNLGQFAGIQVLANSSIEEMTQPQFPDFLQPDSLNYQERNSGIFWAIRNGRVGHSGGDPGVMTGMHYDLSKGVGIILFANTSSKSAYEAYKAIDLALWEYAERLRETLKKRVE